jgi:hypothetical protein
MNERRGSHDISEGRLAGRHSEEDSLDDELYYEGYDYTRDEEAFDEPTDHDYPDRRHFLDDENYPLPGEHPRAYWEDDDEDDLDVDMRRAA